MSTISRTLLPTRHRLATIPRAGAAARIASPRPTSLPVRRCLHCSSRRLAADTTTPHSKVKVNDAASYKDPITRYDHLVATGSLRRDESQRDIIKHLQRLWTDLKDYDPGPLPPESAPAPTSIFGKLFGRDSIPQSTVHIDQVPKSLYLYGSVGTGKTMLMDLFHSTLPPQFASKRYGSTRIHFHSFMLDVLARQHQTIKKYEMLGLGRRDALPEVARSLAAEGRVFCFDEMQVTDIVTAMLQRKLLEALMRFGVVFVMTSNRHPDDLYLNGIQRESFLPAIALIKERFEIVDLNSGTDYRKIPRALSHTYYHPLDPSTRSEMAKLFKSLTEEDPAGTEVMQGRTLPLWGRTLAIPESSGSIARFSFAELCNKPLSAADYLEITREFGTIFVEDIPRLSLSERDQARRFITFIDACYENKVKIFTSSDVPIFQIFSDEHGGAASEHAHVKSVMEEAGVSADSVGTTSLFSGDEELFAFARCVSRLSQMGTQEWSESSGLHREPARAETSETETHP